MRLRSGLFLAYVVCAVLAIYWLPLHVSVAPSGSISYMLGFNNHAALMALVAALCVGCFTVRGFDAEPPEPGHDGHVSKGAVGRVLVATALLCGLMTLIASPTWGIDESPYLIGRIHLVLAGHRPYQDFEYIYGPLLLYVPAWVARFAHLGIGPAYFLVWGIEWIAGTAMLAWIIGELGFSAARARVAFLLFWSAFLSSLMNTGETYTPLRELAAPASMLLVQRALDSQRRWTAFAVAPVCAAVLFCISPEFAIAFMLAATCYLGLCGVGRDRWWQSLWFRLGFVAMLGSFGLLQLVASGLHEFDSARQFSAGGSDIPLLLSPTTLLVFAGLFVAGSFGARRVLTLNVRDARVALVVLGVTLLPGMMGRADPSHLILYGMGMLMVALAVLSARSEKIWRLTTFLFVLLFTAPLVAQKVLIDFLPLFDAGGRMLYPHGVAEPGTLGARFDAAVLRRWGKGAEGNLMREIQIADPDPHAVYPGSSPILMAPFGYFVRGREKQVRPDVDLGYFDGTVDLMSPRQVAEKISELRAHAERDLLLPVGFSKGTGCEENTVWAVGLLRLNFGFSYLTRERHTPHLLDPLCAYIDENYSQVAKPTHDESLYELWRRKDQSGPRDTSDPALHNTSSGG